APGAVQPRQCHSSGRRAGRHCRRHRAQPDLFQRDDYPRAATGRITGGAPGGPRHPRRRSGQPPPARRSGGGRSHHPGGDRTHHRRRYRGPRRRSEGGAGMSMNMQGRPTGIGTVGTAASGSALLPDEPLLCEIGDTGHSGVDLPEIELPHDRLGGFQRRTALDLAGLTEPEAMRHSVRLSRLNHSIDSGMYPLGSCTMKHNPRLNEKMARLPGFADIHPLQPVSTVQGALELMNQLARWLMTLTNTAAVALSPKAGAHGELLGMMAIKAAQAARGEGHRNTVLVPESAHGTNPATAAFLGYAVR